MKNLIIIGTGAFARELHGYLKRCIGYGTEWTFKGYIDGDVKVSEEEYAKLSGEVLGDIFNYEIQPDDVFTCSMAVPEIRKKIINIMLDRSAEFISIIHDTAIVQDNVTLGNGLIVSPYCFINDHSVVGDYVMMNGLADIGHDSVVGEFTCMMGHVDITGGVKVGKGCFFGSGSRVVPHCEVGDYAYVGAGAVVLKPVKEGTTVFGNPAKVLPVPSRKK